MSYSEAKKKYAAIGVDTEKAIRALKKIPISLNSWQLDDIGGWEHPTTTALGNYPGRPRTPDELFADLDLALRLSPGRHRINVHSLQNIQTGANRVDRDALTLKDFRPWIDFAKRHKVGFDFNPSCFMHPKADGGALSDGDEDNRKFWIRHCLASLKIAEQVAKELKSPVSWTLWIAAGKHDDPSDRMGPRRRFKESLDEILRKTKVDRKLVKICLESQLWSPSAESYAVGSHEFMTNYAAKNDLLCLLDMAHFHPTENVADKISSMLLFSEMVAFHIARPVRFSCPHVSRFDDMLRDVAREIVANGPEKFLVALDFCDATMNRVAGLVQGTRNVQLALMEALLLPRKELVKLQDARRFTEEFVLSESMKTYPLGEVYDEFCRREKKPVGLDWLKTVIDYEKKVQFKRT